MQCFREFPVAKKFMDKRGRGVSRFSVEFFCLSAEKFRRGTFVLLQKFPLAKKFIDKRGRGVSRFSVEFFCLTVAKNFAAEPFCAVFQKLPVAKKLMEKKGGGGVSRCSVENFLSHSAENFRTGESFSVSLISGIEKVWIRGGSIKIFCRIFLSQCRKISQGNLCAASEISASEKVYG